MIKTTIIKLLVRLTANFLLRFYIHSYILPFLLLELILIFSHIWDLRELRSGLNDACYPVFPEMFLFIFEVFFGVYTVIDMATAYGTALGLDTAGLLLALLVTQVVAFPAPSFLDGSPESWMQRSSCPFALPLTLALLCLPSG